MAKPTPGLSLDKISRVRLSSWAGRTARISFSLWLLLSLTTPSWRYGPFSWWPLFQLELLAGGPATLGLLNLLPLLLLGAWLAERLLSGERSWNWGHPAVTLPFAALTLLGMLRLTDASNRLIFIYAGALLLAWIAYLFVLNERPTLWLPLALVLLLQSGVALGQFFLQRDLGLVALGELPLDPSWRGITVLAARGRPWLRAYGLTAHPNLLGALLVALLLLLLPAVSAVKGRGRYLLQLAFLSGMLGLVVSFSRAAWLGAAAGFLLAAGLHLRTRRYTSRSFSGWRPLSWLLLLFPVVLLVIYRDLALSRFLALDTQVEAQSISERLRDAELALEVIERNLWGGVGLGRYVDAATDLNPDAARVHNVTLLVTAELGLPGLFLWLALAVAPFWLAVRGKVAINLLVPWVAMLVMNLFDTMLWWGGNWQTAMVFGLLLAHLRHQVAVGAEAVNDEERL